MKDIPEDPTLGNLRMEEVLRQQPSEGRERHLPLMSSLHDQSKAWCSDSLLAAVNTDYIYSDKKFRWSRKNIEHLGYLCTDVIF
jgi:hypothetical protein